MTAIEGAELDVIQGGHNVASNVVNVTQRRQRT